MKITPLENWIIEKTRIGEKSRELLEEYQLCRIKETLSYAKNKSRFYGENLKNINPDEINSLNDLQNLPFTFPQDILKDPFQFLCVPQSDIKRIVSLKSTGTSGKEKRIFFTGEDLNLTIDFFVHGMSCLISESDRVMVLLPGNSYGSIGDLLKKALEKMNIECFVPGVVINTEDTAKEIIEKNITCLVGIPIQVLNLSRMENEVFKSRIKTVLLSTDYVPEIVIRELTNQCACRVFTHYGMTEMGYGGGVECEALNGYHLREADLYFEIVDPVSGLNVPDGQFGEVVFTSFARQAMPLIRYRTGDIAAFSSESCECGTFLKTMKRVRGRIDNKIKICENEYLTLAELDELILSFREVLDYRVCLLDSNNLSVAIVTENEEVFQNIQDVITNCIQKYLYERFGKISDIQVTVSRNDETFKIVNSMVKRAI